MNIILIPEGFRKGPTVSFSHRQLAAMALAGLVVLPLVVGYVVSDIYTRLHPPTTLDARVLAAHQAELTAQRAAIVATRHQAETHLNALAQRLGQLQAQMWRVNALGGQLVAMAGLDKAEFDFSAEPAMGGPEASVSATAPALFPALETLDAQLAAQRERLTALETLLMNRQLEAAVSPAEIGRAHV